MNFLNLYFNFDINRLRCIAVSGKDTGTSSTETRGGPTSQAVAELSKKVCLSKSFYLMFIKRFLYLNMYPKGFI